MPYILCGKVSVYYGLTSRPALLGKRDNGNELAFSRLFLLGSSGGARNLFLRRSYVNFFFFFLGMKCKIVVCNIS